MWRVARLAALLAAFAVLGALCTDDDAILPTDMDASECFTWKARALRGEGELHRARALIRKGGFYDLSDERAVGARLAAVDVLQNILSQAARVARSQRCSRCIERVCGERDFERFFTDASHSALQHGRHVNAATGCVAAMRLVTRVLREESLNKAHTRTTRRVAFSAPRVAHLIEEDLDSGATERDPDTGALVQLHVAETTMQLADDPCAANGTAMVTHFDVGRGSTRHYMLHLNEHGAVSQLFVTLVEHK